MVTALTTLLTVFTSGAGGGIVGGIFGLFKQSQERKERVEMARIELDRDEAEYANAKAEREHAIAILDKQGEIQVRAIETEAEAEIEVSRMDVLGSAQQALNSLNTSSGMDNFRASVRPVLAYWWSAVFSCVLGYAFYEFSDTISEDQGNQILMGLVATLTFIVTSIISFYYVSRRNSAPRI